MWRGGVPTLDFGFIPERKPFRLKPPYSALKLSGYESDNTGTDHTLDAATCSGKPSHTFRIRTTGEAPMFSPGHAGANAYARVGVETGVLGASPHRLIVMLYQGARQAIAQARMHLQQGNVAERGKAISKAIRIVESGLQQSLNVEAGGEVGQRLYALYAYMTRRLFEANVKQSEAMLVEVDGLLATLEEAWVGIGPEIARMAGQPAAESIR
jgi:flagellar protein FliS